MQVEIGQIYRHFKGNFYEIKGFANNSENNEEVVIYNAMYLTNGDFKTWVRPLAMFTEEVDKGFYKGPRFKFINSGRIPYLKEIVYQKCTDGMTKEEFKIGIEKLLLFATSKMNYEDQVKMFNPSYRLPEPLKYNVVEETDTEITIWAYSPPTDYIPELLKRIDGKETVVIAEYISSFGYSVVQKIPFSSSHKYMIGFRTANTNYLYMSNNSELPDLIKDKDNKGERFYQFFKEITKFDQWIHCGYTISVFLPANNTEDPFYKELCTWVEEMGNITVREK